MNTFGCGVFLSPQTLPVRRDQAITLERIPPLSDRRPG